MSTKKNWLIIANGEKVSKKQLHNFAQDKKILALDGAILSCLKKDIVPDIVLGDFDSLSFKQIHHWKKEYSIEFIHTPDQNATDLKKALNYLIPLSPHSVIICQATGLRLDHSLYNLRLLKSNYHLFNNIALYTAREKVFFIHNQHFHLTATKPQPMALLGFPKALITSKGLKYNMEKWPLEFGLQESTSNYLIAPTADIIVEGDALLIISHATQVHF